MCPFALHARVLVIAQFALASSGDGGTCMVVVALTVAVAVASALSGHGVAFVRLAAYGCFWLVLVLVALALWWWY